MRQQFYSKCVFFVVVIIISSTQLPAQSTPKPPEPKKDNWAGYDYNLYYFDNLDKKYKYSSSNLDARQLKINRINFLNFQARYLLDSCYRKNRSGYGKYFEEDYNNFTKLLLYTTKTSNLDSVERILDFLSFEITAKYLDKNATDTLVRVIVKVANETTNEELSGYNVFAKPSLSIDENDIIPFNPTNNAIKNIRPGRKTFWIEKNGIKLKEIKDWGVSIGDENTHMLIFVINN